MKFVGDDDDDDRYIVRCRAYFDILNCLGVDYERNGQIDERTDGRTDGLSDSKCRASLRCAAKHCI